MIISRTPFRISFAGGGTDLRSFYKNEPGEVLSTSIDKYLYVILRRQLGLVEFKYRLNYSTVEFCKTIDEIQHPIVREALRMYNIDFPVEVTTFAVFPAYTGLGSSSLQRGSGLCPVRIIGKAGHQGPVVGHGNAYRSGRAWTDDGKTGPLRVGVREF